MKRRLGAGAYTLLEVMIVLAVSSALLVSSMLLIGGQRNRTEFTQSVREIESQINDVINDVSTGYYANTGNFTCDGSTGRPRIQAAAADSQGTNSDCVFIGRVMQFGVLGSDGEGFNTYNIVGLRQVESGGSFSNSASLAEARPTAMAPGSGAGANHPDSTDRQKLQFGLNAASMRVGSQNFGAVGFFGSLSPATIGGTNLLSGAQTIQLVPIPNTTLNTSPAVTVDAINNLGTAAVNLNPTGGVVLCFQSGGTNQYAQITIGSNARRLTTTTQIQSGSCP